MGIKKMFMKKDPTEQEIREDLNRVGITTKSGTQEKKSLEHSRTTLKKGHK